MGSAAIPSATNLAAGLTVGSSAISGMGNILQGNAASSAVGYNATVAMQNSALSTQNAGLAGAIGDQNVAVQEEKTRAKIGETLANQGASGVNVNTGSAVGVRESEAKVGALDALNIRSQAARQAYGLETQAAAEAGQAGLYRSEAAADKKAGYINAAATVLGGVGKAAGYISGGDNITPAAKKYLGNSGTAAALHFYPDPGEDVE